MAWRECCVMDERVRFVARVLEGESVSELCREFGISRKTGHKFINRYEKFGLEALSDQSRKPLRNANRLPHPIEKIVLEIKSEKPNWGARKIREIFIRRYPEVKPPAKSTVHAVLQRNDKVGKRGRPRCHATGTPLSLPRNPHDLWATDFKGQFRLGNSSYCYPFTLTDVASRFLLACEALDSAQERHLYLIFEEIFQEHGLPLAIRSDNGTPFASPRGLFGLSRLSVWWLTLGIGIERIQPGNPQQNGCHERMHRTLKRDTTKPPGTNSLHQQELFDRFVHEFNYERPHEALDMKFPAECYVPSSRRYAGPLPFDYPTDDLTLRISQDGYACMHGTRVFVSTALAGQPVGISEQDEGIWKLSFRQYEFGYFDLECKKFEQAVNPFAIHV